jgi:hypothetical protein
MNFRFKKLDMESNYPRRQNSSETKYGEFSSTRTRTQSKHENEFDILSLVLCSTSFSTWHELTWISANDLKTNSWIQSPLPPLCSLLVTSLRLYGILSRVSLTKDGVRIDNWNFYHLQVVTTINSYTLKLTITIAHKSMSINSSQLNPHNSLPWRFRVYYSLTVTVLFFCGGALSDERMGLSFVYTAGPHQHNVSRVQVPSDSWPYFTASDLRICIFVTSYDSQGHGGGTRTRLHTGGQTIFTFLINLRHGPCGKQLLLLKHMYWTIA